MTTRTGGQLVVESLVRQGVESVFVLPGVQLDWILDGLYERREQIRVYHTRHEQTTAYMADGYARTSGQVGVCMVVPGPGLLNASAALATAFACSSPVLCVTGQVDSRTIDHGFGMLHEILHQENVLGSITAWSGRAAHADDIPGLVRHAFEQLRTGRPRPVALELPPDVLQQRTERAVAEPVVAPTLEPDPDLLRLAAGILRRAERPVLYSGGGTLASGAWAELTRLAELLEAPVVMSVDGRGALSDRHDLAHTGLTGEGLVAEADVVVAIGTRFWQPARIWGLPPGVQIVRIDADAAEIDRLGLAQLGIVADARAALAALCEELDGIVARPGRRAELREMKARAAEQLHAYQPQARFCAAMRSALPDDAITVNDLTQVTFYGTIGFPVYAPRTFIGPGYQGTLGSAFPTALGAQVANPDRAVVAVAGDGGFMYAVGELAMQRQHQLPVVSVVFNDGAFGNVKRTQQLQFDGHLIGSDLVNPDFVTLARAFGVDAERVAEPQALEGALRSAVAARRPALIEVAVGEMSNVFPLAGRAGGLYPVLLG
jgi:acetolactate synthase I/II/III large subunit